MVRGAGRFDGAELRRRRQAAGLSQRQVAEMVGATRRQILAYEQSRSTPEPARLVALAAAVSCDPAVLVGPPSQVGLAGLRRMAGLTRAEAAVRLAELLGGRAPASKWMLERAETGRIPVAWRAASSHAGIVAAMAQVYGVSAHVVAQAWPVSGPEATARSPRPPTPEPVAHRPQGLGGPDPAVTAVALPDPGRATTVEELVQQLRLLKIWAGDPSYGTIRERVNARWLAAGRPAGELAGRTTVVDAFRPGRRRLNNELVVAVVQALHPAVGYVTQWRQALRVVGGRSSAASQVRVQDTLPPDLSVFTGRVAELDRLRRVLADGMDEGAPVVISAIAGMAGVGKTGLAVHAAHLFIRAQLVDRVLFVNLRGFHPDADQPPADPAAVLDGFLRLLGLPGQEIPYDVVGRTRAFRGLLAGTRTLIVLDNAAEADQVRPLLSETPGCPVLVTSRSDLTGLRPAAHLTVDVFTLDEARHLLTRAMPHVPVGDDPEALSRIAERCGYLPLALDLMARHMRAKPDWTLTDHANWLDERHSDGRLDTGVELALDLSYQRLSADRRRLLRLLALHPGQDLDGYAAAALTGTDVTLAEASLRHLCAEHLLQPGALGRYTMHDLIRAYATAKAKDEDRLLERRAALTRLFDYYLNTAATAMNALGPHRPRPRPETSPTGSATPELVAPEDARQWLDAERPSLVAIAACTAAHGWPGHTTRLARTLYRYLDGVHNTDAATVHGHAYDAARQSGDYAAQAHALTSLGAADRRMGRYGAAAERFRHALELFRLADDPAGEALTLTSLGAVEERSGDYQAAEASNLRALAMFRQLGNRTGEAAALGALGHIYVRSARHQQAADHLQQSLALFRSIGNRIGEADVLDGLGVLCTHRGRPDQGADYHRRALALLRQSNDRELEIWALNGLGEAAHAAGRFTDAISHHTEAGAIADRIGVRGQQGRAHAGLGHAHRALGDPVLARQHYEQALAWYAGLPDVDEIHQHLTDLATTAPLPASSDTDDGEASGGRD